MSPAPECTRTDAVLSHFLDGDASAQRAEALSNHLDHCDPCRDTLRAGRRLDALLAAQAGQQMDRARADAVLARMLEEVTPPPPRRRRRMARRVLVGAGLLAAGFVAAWGFLPREVVQVVEVVEISEPTPLNDAIRLPAPAGPREREEEAPPPPPSAAELRRLQARALLGSGDSRSLQAWAEMVGAEADGAVLEQLVADGRGRSSVRRHLGQLLRGSEIDDSSLAVTLRIASEELDDLLMQTVRRDPRLIHRVASVLAAIEERPRRTLLLLDLWTDLHARGHLEDGEEAARLFGPQPAPTTSELIEEARTTGNGSRRQRCLLALAMRADPSSFDYLLSLVQSPNQSDAVVAAFALSQLPAALLDDSFDETAGSRRARSRVWLLQAAMASAGCAVVAQWLPEMELTPEEAQFLSTGSFSHAQFPIAASLFRERGISVY